MKIEQLSLGMTLPGAEKTKNVPNQSAFDQLWNVVGEMDQTQKHAQTKVQDVILGKSDDSHGALIALEKAELQLNLATTVRDKFIQGYQQIINMQL